MYWDVCGFRFLHMIFDKLQINYFKNEKIFYWLQIWEIENKYSLKENRKYFVERERGREREKEREEKENGYVRVETQEVCRYFALRARLIIDRGKFPPRARPIINYN